MSSGLADTCELHVFSDSELLACTEGECCGCGACCFAFNVEVPVPGESLRSVQRDNTTDEVMMIEKKGGELCPHIQVSSEGTLDCGLHESPYKPEACQQWHGAGEMYFHQFPIPSYQYLMRCMHRTLLSPTREEQIEQIKVFIHTNALALVNQVLPHHANNQLGIIQNLDQFERFVTSYLSGLNIYDEEICEFIGIATFVHHARPRLIPELIKILIDAKLSPANEAHRNFVERYFTEEEQHQIFAE